jgi:hypothetical protein
VVAKDLTVDVALLLDDPLRVDGNPKVKLLTGYKIKLLTKFGFLKFINGAYFI